MINFSVIFIEFFPLMEKVDDKYTLRKILARTSTKMLRILIYGVN